MSKIKSISNKDVYEVETKIKDLLKYFAGLTRFTVIPLDFKIAKLEREEIIIDNGKAPFIIFRLPWRGGSKKEIDIVITINQHIGVDMCNGERKLIVTASNIHVTYFESKGELTRVEEPEEWLPLQVVHYHMDRNKNHPLFHAQVSDDPHTFLNNEIEAYRKVKNFKNGFELRIASPPVDLGAVLLGVIVCHLNEQQFEDLVTTRGLNKYIEKIDSLPKMPCSPIIDNIAKKGYMLSRFWYNGFESW